MSGNAGKWVTEDEHGDWQEWDDGWFNYHYCTSCGYKHFDPEKKVLPRRCPNCNKPMKGEDDDE